MVSTFGTLNTVLFTSPRVFFAMAADRLFFAPVASVHPRFGTPWISISMTAGLGIVFVLSRSFEQLADAFVTAFLPFYALAVASIFRLRKKPGYAPTFRVPFYPRPARSSSSRPSSTSSATRSPARAAAESRSPSSASSRRGSRSTTSRSAGRAGAGRVATLNGKSR